MSMDTCQCFCVPETCMAKIYYGVGSWFLKCLRGFVECKAAEWSDIKIKQIDNCSFYQHIKVIGKDDFGLIFECQKFDKEKRLCTDHKNRPPICVNYPSEEIFKMGAQLRDECGYSFEPIEKFDEVFAKISKKPVKNFQEFMDEN